MTAAAAFFGGILFAQHVRAKQPSFLSILLKSIESLKEKDEKDNKAVA
jgi:hypothetical protein